MASTQKEYTDVTLVVSYAGDGLYFNAEIENDDNGNPQHYLPNVRYLARLYHSPSFSSIDVYCNFGSVGIDKYNVTKEISETIIFTGSSSINLSKMFSENFSYTTIGRVYDKDGKRYTPTLIPTVGAEELISDKEIYGVFEITYITKYDHYWFQASRTGTMLIFWIGEV